MAKSNADLSKNIGNTPRIASLQIQDTLVKWREQHIAKLTALAGSADAADKVFVVCMNTITRNPKLLECTFESIANCILQSFQLNLFPGPFQECGYVPLKNGKLSERAGHDVTEANFWPQYQGIVKLMRNAGNKSIVARVVFENDYFEYHEGEKGPVYAPAVVCGKKRGLPLFTYAAVCNASGNYQVEVMDHDQVMEIKSRSRGAAKSDSPWNSKYDDDRYMMWAKTCLKRVSKWCTKSSELVAAFELDNEVDGDPMIKSNVIELIGSSEKKDTPFAPADEGADDDENEAPKAPVTPAQPLQLEHQEREVLDLTKTTAPAEKFAVKSSVELAQERVTRDAKK